MIHWIDFVFCVADAEGPKKGGKPPRPGLHPDIPTSNAGEEVVGCVKKILYPLKMYPISEYHLDSPLKNLPELPFPKEGGFLRRVGALKHMTWHFPAWDLMVFWPNPHIHLSLDSLWIARNQSKSCYLCSGASRGTWFCSLFDSFTWSSRQVD